MGGNAISHSIVSMGASPWSEPWTDSWNPPGTSQCGGSPPKSQRQKSGLPPIWTGRTSPTSARIPHPSPGSSRAFTRFAYPSGGCRKLLASRRTSLLGPGPGSKRRSPPQGYDLMPKMWSQPPRVIPHPPYPTASFPHPSCRAKCWNGVCWAPTRSRTCFIWGIGCGGWLPSSKITTASLMWKCMNWIRSLVWLVARPLQPLAGNSTKPAFFGKDKQ